MRLKYTTLTPLSLLISCKLSFPTAGLKISFLPIFSVNLLWEFPCGMLGNDQIHVPVPCESYPFYYNFRHQMAYAHSEQ